MRFGFVAISDGEVGVSNEALGTVIGVAWAARPLSIAAMAAKVILVMYDLRFIKILGWWVSGLFSSRKSIRVLT